MRILVVEDEREIADRMVSRLSASGFVTELARDAETALDWPDAKAFAALVLDIGLPGLSGIDLIRKWRERGLSTPILVLSARGAWNEKVDCLNLGADDYIVKPVRSEEIVARLNALLRRAAGHTNPHICAGNIALDPGSKSVWMDGSLLSLSKIEYRLLHLFLLRAGHTLAQTDILDHLYPMATERDLNTVEVHIGRLRRKIGRDAITTIRGLGYRFER
jgi:two-component system, OmpR family, response regulator